MEKRNSVDLKKLVTARVEKEKAKLLDQEKPTLAEKNNKNFQFERECLGQAEYGDGVLYADTHKDQFIFNKSSGEWLYYGGHSWCEDLMNNATGGVERVNARYFQAAAETHEKSERAIKKGDTKKAEQLQADEKLYHKKILKLRTKRGVQNCLYFAHSNPINALQISGDEIDQKRWSLGCRNGVVDLRTGELHNGKPGDFLMKSSPVDFISIEEKAPQWDETLIAIFEDQEMVDYVQRLFGYSITGLTVEPILPVLYGQGRNGKTTIVETIGAVLGPLAGPIQSEMLLDQGRFQNPSAPSPDIMDLRGIRIAFAAETEENRRFSSSKVKLLSGSDTLVGRAPHDKRNTKFKPTHTLMLMTNHQPAAPMSDFAFWERIHLIPFPFSFVDREPKSPNERRADKHLTEKLTREFPGILAWLVRGCLKWQRVGLSPPETVRIATKDYQRNEDLLADFLEQRCFEGPEESEAAADLYDNFKSWWTDNVSKNALSQKRFGKLLRQRFKAKKSSTVRYIGLRLLNRG